MEVKRTLLAVSLTLAVLILWSVLFPPPTVRPLDPARPTRSESESTPVPSREPIAADTPTPDTVTTLPENSEVAAEGPVLAHAAVQSEIIEIKGPLFEVTLANQGGEIVQWRLPEYRQHIVPPGGESPDLRVMDSAEGYHVRALAIVTGDPLIDARLAAALFEVEGRSITLEKGGVASVRFEWSEGPIYVAKALTFHADSYVVDVSIETRGLPESSPPAVVVGVGLEGEGVTDRTHYFGQGVVLAEKVERLPVTQFSEKKLSDSANGQWPPKSGTERETIEAAGEFQRRTNVTWTGLESNYFAAVAFAEEPLREVIFYPSLVAFGKPLRVISGVSLDAGKSRLRFYVGPKEPSRLEAVHPDLAKLIDYGMFESLAKVMFTGLSLLYGYVGNWGIAIVLLTVVIKILFLPLTIKQMATAEKMAKLSPKLKEIEARYKKKQSDATTRMEANRQMQAERMKLFETEKVNPLGGCLPMLLYLPFLYGFYSLLSVCIELRHAPFLLWIQDLSAKDPYYVTPVLMMVSMIAQQAVTPMAGDPVQRRMMYFMPVIFGWVLKDMASGLVLFWLTQNILSIAQQLITNRLKQRKEAAAAATGKLRRNA